MSRSYFNFVRKNDIPFVRSKGGVRITKTRGGTMHFDLYDNHHSELVLVDGVQKTWRVKFDSSGVIDAAE